MDFQNFVKVSNSENLTFSEIWKIYDSQFEAIKCFLRTLGDKYVVEEFKDSTSNVLTLDNSYFSGQLFLYLNGVIQWKDTDYIEYSSNEIRLNFDRKTSDVIKVVIIKSNILQVNIEDYVRQIQEIYENSTSNVEKAQKIIESINLLEAELDNKRKEFESKKTILEEFLVGFDNKVSESEENVAKIEEIKSVIDENLIESDACLGQIRSLRDEIERLSLLTPEEIVDNEVVIARNGATTLGTRLNSTVYKFKSVEDMQKCQFLIEGDECWVTDDSNISELVTAKIYRVCIDEEDIPKYATEHYKILSYDYMYAYLLNEVASVPYLKRLLNESCFELDVKSLCQSCGLLYLIIENFDSTSSLDMKFDSTSSTLNNYWSSSNHVVSGKDFNNNVIKSVTMDLESTPSHLLVVCDYEGSGSVELEMSFDGGSNRFSVKNKELTDLSNIYYSDGRKMHPSVKMIGYITLNGDITLKNICWAVR